LFFSTKKEKEERGSHQDTPARCVKAAWVEGQQTRELVVDQRRS
jgi:hypothetical protein